jgi:hypothetical protein
MRTPKIRNLWTSGHDPGTSGNEGDGDEFGLRALTHIVEQVAVQAAGEVREGANVESNEK